MERKDFEKAINELHLGHVPDNMPAVASYIRGTSKELSEYASAITECVFRLQTTNSILRDMNEGLRSMIRKRDKINQDHFHKKYAALVQWFQEAILSDVENGKYHDAKMLCEAVKMILRSEKTGGKN